MQMPPSPGSNFSGNNTGGLCEQEAESGIAHTQAPRNAQQAPAGETPWGRTQTFPVTPTTPSRKSSSHLVFCTHALATQLKLPWHSCVPRSLMPEPVSTRNDLGDGTTTANSHPATPVPGPSISPGQSVSLVAKLAQLWASAAPQATAFARCPVSLPIAGRNAAPQAGAARLTASSFANLQVCGSTPSLCRLHCAGSSEK